MRHLSPALRSFKCPYQFPGVADVVRVFTDVSQSVHVPGQRRVDGYGDDLTSQRKAGRAMVTEKGKEFKREEEFWPLSSSVPRRFPPEDVLSDSRESWDVLVVDDVSVQRSLRHQVRPGE